MTQKTTLGYPPIYTNIIKPQEHGAGANEFHQEWQDWMNENHRNVETHNYIANECLVLNPDFHWSRINGETPIAGDGEIVDEWFIRSNGSLFTSTPTFYTATDPSSATGSAHYINFNITTPAVGTNFELYQQYTNGISRFENKKIATAALIRNNGNPFSVRFYIGFDTNNDGTDEVVKQGGAVEIKDTNEHVDTLLETPTISADNQNNKINFKLLIDDLTADVLDFDVFFIKFELSDNTTPLYVDHTLEKLKIDNL